MSRFTDLFQQKEVKVSNAVPAESTPKVTQNPVEEPKETKVESVLGRIKKRKIAE